MSFGRPPGFVDPDDCQSSADSAPAARPRSASIDQIAILARQVFSRRPIRPKLLDSFPLRPTSRLLQPPLLLSAGRLRLQLQRSLWLWPNPRPSWPLCSEPSAPTALAARQPLASADPTANVPPAACQLSANMALTSPQASATADAMALVALAGCQSSAFTAQAALQPPVPPLVYSIRPIQPYLHRSL